MGSRGYHQVNRRHHLITILDSQLATWLLGRIDQEQVVCLTPRWVSGWDYSERMSDAR